MKWGQKHVSVGGLGDSFYEYLIKTYIYTTEKDTVALEMYNDALDGIREHLVRSVFYSYTRLRPVGQFFSPRLRSVGQFFDAPTGHKRV